MTEAEYEIEVSRNADVVLDLLRNLKFIGTCFKFVGDVSDDGIVWKVKAPMSAITRTKKLNVELTSHDPPEWVAKGEHLIWKGRFQIEDRGERRTGIKIWLSVEGTGAMAPIINPMAGMQIGGQLKYFADKLKEKMESTAK